MTPEQVATVLKQPLGEGKQQRPNSPFHKYGLHDVTVGAWGVNVDLFFRTSSAGGSFTGVTLRYPQQAGFGSIRDELKSTYGPPTFEENQGRSERVTWVFPDTHIICERLTFASSTYMGVTFEQHSK